mmetsp:Transcript_866/g.2323  ORF Transcript_866/g.2323 Transcript_866/m.2323 type:complete len:490 (-) Transcript_866:150-1619(-)
MPELDYAKKESPLVLTTGPILPRWAVDAIAGGGAARGDAEAERRKLLGRPTSGEVLFELPPLIERWMRPRDPEARVVYVDLGHMPKLDSKMIELLAKGLNPATHQASYQVFWLVHDAHRKLLPFPLPEHVLVKVHGSIPHLRILSSPSIKAVFSHCGGSAVGEALAFGKPLLCLPFFIDQNDLAARVQDSGAGIALDKMSLHSLDISASLERLLDDESYRQAAERFALKYRFHDGLNVAATEVENILKRGSWPAKPLGAEAPWHRNEMLDVYFLVSALLCLGFVLAYGVTIMGFGWTMVFARIFQSDVPLIEYMRDLGLPGYVGVLHWETQKASPKADDEAGAKARNGASASAKDAPAGSGSPGRRGDGFGEWPGISPAMDKARDLHGEIAALERSHMSKMGVIADDDAQAAYTVGNSDPTEPPGFAAIMTSVAVVDAAVTAMTEPDGSESRRIAEQLRDRLRDCTLERRRRQERLYFGKGEGGDGAAA